MITDERVFELMKEAGLDEEKFARLLAKEEPKLLELNESELDQVTGGFWGALLGGLGTLVTPLLSKWFGGGNSSTSTPKPAQTSTSAAPVKTGNGNTYNLNSGTGQTGNISVQGGGKQAQNITVGDAHGNIM